MRVLVLIHDDPGQEARIAAALAVVRATGGELHCVDVTVRPVMPDVSFDPYAQAALMQEEDAREAANKQALTARFERSDVTYRWWDAVGSPAACLRGFAEGADLIVVSRQLDSYCAEDMRAVATDVVTHAGKPVLAVPQSGRPLDLSGRVLLAWNGSLQSNRALAAALPLLRFAREAVLCQVGPIRTRLSAGRIESFLRHKGVNVRLRKEAAGTRPTADSLLAAAAAERADYVVMGGFGRWPIVEALFGGVSRTVLTRSPVPVLLVH